MSSDQGVSMLRMLLRRQLEAVARGENPAGTAFSEADAYIRFESGQYLEDATAA